MPPRHIDSFPYAELMTVRWGDFDEKGFYDNPECAFFKNKTQPLPATVGGGSGAPESATPAAAVPTEGVAAHPIADVTPTRVAEDQPTAPVQKRFKVFSRVFDERGLHGSSYVTPAGADGLPSVMPTTCPVKAVGMFLTRSENTIHVRIGEMLLRGATMFELKKTFVVGKTSAWDFLSGHKSQKVQGLVDVPDYWCKKTGKFVGYYSLEVSTA